MEIFFSEFENMYNIKTNFVQFLGLNQAIKDFAKNYKIIHFTKKFITKTCLYNFDPHKPHFYIVKLGFTGVYNIFLISAQKHRLWVLVRTASSRRF